MYKNKIFGYAILLAVVVLSSCADDSLSPIVTKENIGYGGYPRLVKLISGEYDLNSISTSTFAYEVEFVTKEKGTDITSYDVNVSFNGADPVLWKSFGQSDFASSAKGFQGITVSIPLTEAASTTGQDVNNLVPGDKFTFNTVVTLASGGIFEFANSSAAVNGSAFQGYFKPSANVTCPMTETQYVGTYAVSYVDINDAPNCFTGAPTLGTSIPNMILSEVSGSTTKRSVVSVDDIIPWALSGFEYSGTALLDFVCVEVGMQAGWELNGSCGGSIELLGGTATAISADLSDDASFIINVNEFANGECGCPEVQFQLQFTKI